jgi:MFS family permease
MVAVLATQRAALGAAHHDTRGRGAVAEARLLLSAPILSAFAYFALIATALIGVQTFGVTGLMRVYDTPLALATAALTAFLLGGVGGILVGGFLADHTRRHDIVAVTGLVAAATFMTLLATGALAPSLLPVILAVTGFCHGATGPSRDMLVRAATPPGASGKVFGFVYSGLDLGSCVTPLAFGWLLDHGDPRALFAAVAVLMLHRRAGPPERPARGRYRRSLAARVIPLARGGRTPHPLSSGHLAATGPGRIVERPGLEHGDEDGE